MNEIARPFALAGFAFVLGTASLSAQDKPCRNRTVAVNVMSSEDEAVKGLEAGRFRGKVDGHSAEVVSAKYDTNPRRILFLLDTSCGMTGDAAKWRSELAMAEDLISWMSSRAWVGLVTLAPQTGTEFIQGREAVSAALAKLEAPSSAAASAQAKTSLMEAILHGLTLIDDVHAGDAICVISDGGGELGLSRKDDVEHALMARGVRLFGFLPESAVASGGAAGAVEAAGPMALRELIEFTGGDFLVFSSTPKTSAASGSPDLSPQDRNKLLVASRSFAQEMNEFYLLQIKLPEPGSTADGWTLEAMGEGKKKVSQWRVIYPKRLAKCP